MSECECEPDDPCFCFPALMHPQPRYTVRPSTKFVEQARGLGAARYPLRGVNHGERLG